MDERPWWKDGRVWILLLVTGLTLQLGWMHKSRCHDRGWDGYQWREACYSDIQALYGTRGAADGTWPYIETFNEYPVLTGVFMHAVGEWTESPADVPADRNDYLAWSALLLVPFALAITLFLALLVTPSRPVLYWALAPALGIYAFYNWDLLAVAPAIAAVWAYQRGRMGWAGALLGLGACAKLFPALLAPALGLALLRRDGGLRRDGWAFGIGFFAVALAVHLPFLLQDASLTLEAYTWQAKRAPNFETLYYAMGHIGREWDVAWMDRVDDKGVYGWLSPLGIGLGLAASGWAAWTRRLDPVSAGTLAVLAFLAFNKVYSIQYTLWLVPLALLSGLPRLHKTLIVVADLAVFLTLGNYFALWDLLRDGHLFTPAAYAVLFRFGVLVACAMHLVTRSRQAAPGWGPAGAERSILPAAGAPAALLARLPVTATPGTVPPQGRGPQ